MRARFRPLAVFLALLLALPLQAYAVYAASDCPMGMHEGGAPMHDSHDDCDGCKGGGCALMSFCHNLQAGALTAHLPAFAVTARGEKILAASADFPSRALAPPLRPPRHV
jgi:hypothetical protein